MRHTATLVILLAGLAHAEPLFVDVTGNLPPIPSGPDEGVEACDGSLKCVDRVVRQMTRRWAKLDRRCDHDAVFALTYLLTTIEYRDAVEDPAFFADNAFVNNEDRHFADYYFDAYDAWHGGDQDAVPLAWQVAFTASDDGQVAGMGNVLLGMNAHIQRDLPFVLYQIGLTGPDGSRKPDHDKVNVILNRVTDDVLREAAERYDPAIDDGDIPGTTLDATAFNLVVQSWREAAWRNAERLAYAPDPEARGEVARDIERSAWLAATVIQAAYRYDGLFRTRADRDAYCAGTPPAPDCECTGAELSLEATLGDIFWARAWAELNLCAD